MASISWNASGIIHRDYPQKERIRNGEYSIHLLKPLNDDLKKKRSHLAGKMCSFNETMHKYTHAQSPKYHDLILFPDNRHCLTAEIDLALIVKLCLNKTMRTLTEFII